MTKQKQTPDNFKVLTPREHVLIRPNMYVGSVTLEDKDQFILGKYITTKYTAGAIKCMNEIIDNSIDQYIRSNGKNANIIKINIDKTTVKVSDNGSGIPNVLKTDLDGTEKFKAHLAWTKTNAGSNFEDDGRNTVGMNGVGSSLTNFFSRRFIGISRDGDVEVTVECHDNCTTEKVTSKKLKGNNGVTVEFDLDLPRFNLTEIDDNHIQIIHDRVTSLSVIFPGIKFYLNDELIHNNIKTYASLYSDDTILHEGDLCSWFVFPNEDGDAKINAFVNGVQTFNGGSHIDYVYERLIETIRPVITKKHDIDVTPAQIRNHLQLVLIMKDFNNPKFDSQTKERLTNSRADVKAFFDKEDIKWDVLAKKILNNEKIMGPIIDALLAKKLMAERRALAAEAKKNSSRIVEKHLKAKETSTASDRQLFIVEGLSAIGSLINVREEYQGGYALKGKIMNINEMSNLDIIKNDEIADLISIIGLSFEHQATVANTKYNEINIFTDADHDGSHIVSLLINFLVRFWPELFIDKRVSLIKSPLVKCSKGSVTKYYYNLHDFNKDADAGNLAGFSFNYKKGLGSLTEDEYRDTIMNRDNYFTIELDEEYKKTLDMAFGKDSQLRKDYLKKQDIKKVEE